MIKLLIPAYRRPELLWQSRRCKMKNKKTIRSTVLAAVAILICAGVANAGTIVPTLDLFSPGLDSKVPLGAANTMLMAVDLSAVGCNCAVQSLLFDSVFVNPLDGSTSVGPATNVWLGFGSTQVGTTLGSIGQFDGIGIVILHNQKGRFDLKGDIPFATADGYLTPMLISGVAVDLFNGNEINFGGLTASTLTLGDPVSELATLLLLATGLALIGGLRRRLA